MKTREITLGAILLAAALTVFVIENQIPVPVPIPGFKIGLSNIITLVTLYMWDKKHSFLILMLRIIISSAMCGSGVTIIYSFFGGITAFAVMAVLKKLFKNQCIPAVSIAGAIFHNAAQLSAAAFVLDTISVFSFFPVLCMLGIVCGLFTGITGSVCINNAHMRNLFKGDSV